MVIVDVQRAGPSTGMPTKTEQADLLMALYGRHGEAPLPVIAAATPADAFDTAMEACRLATKYMTPVILLSDGYIGNSSEPWRLPDVADLPRFPVTKTTEVNATDDDGEPLFLPYLRDETTLARPWAAPGTPGLEHRLGGLEKSDGTGNVDYRPSNHEHMTLLRERKIAGIANDVPDQQVHGPDDADVLVVAWGSTFGAVREAVNRVNRDGGKAAHAHVRHLHPFPANLADILDSFDTVLVPELNRGQLATVLRSTYLKPVVSYPKIQGLPFKAAEIEAKIKEIAS